MQQRLLIVADHPDFNRLCKKISEDFQIVSVPTATQGLEALQEKTPFTMIIVSMQLPDMEGMYFLAKAEKLSNGTLMLLADNDDYRKCLEIMNYIGVFRLLPYPCKEEMLEQVLADASRQARFLTEKNRLNDEVKRLAVTDKLTGCFTVNYLEDRMLNELKRAIRYSQYLAVIMCDLDYMSQTNKKYGHITGDRFLKKFGAITNTIIRTNVDWVARWKRDEFIIILPETPIRGAGIVAERLRLSLKEVELPAKQGVAKMTASFGLTCYAPETPEHNRTPEELLNIAGQCLHQAKLAGHDKVLCCP